MTTGDAIIQKISEWVANIYDLICEKLTIDSISICEPVSQEKP